MNLRPPGPEPGALARLRYAPTAHIRARNIMPEWKNQNNIARCPYLESGIGFSRTCFSLFAFGLFVFYFVCFGSL